MRIPRVIFSERWIVATFRATVPALQAAAQSPFSGELAAIMDGASAPPSWQVAQPITALAPPPLVCHKEDGRLGILLMDTGVPSFRSLLMCLIAIYFSSSWGEILT